MSGKIKTLIAVLISGAMIWLVVRSTNWSEAWGYVQKADFPLLLLAAGVATLMFPLRARRWRILLQNVQPDMPFGPLWRSVAIGVMVTNTVPGRAGEVARAFALNREDPRVPTSAALGSILVDRVFDSIVVLLLLFAAMLAPGFPGGGMIAGKPVSAWVVGILIGLTAVVAGLYALAFFPDRFIGATRAIMRRVAPRLIPLAERILVRFSEGLGALRSPRQFVAVFWWTLLHWLVQPLAFMIGFRAFGIDVSFGAALFMQGVIVISVAFPQLPGFAGMYEAAAALALAPYGVDRALATAWAGAFHIVSFIPITLIGLVYFFRLGLKFADLKTPPAPPNA